MSSNYSITCKLQKCLCKKKKKITLNYHVPRVNLKSKKENTLLPPKHQAYQLT